MQYNFQDIMRFNLAKGLVTNTSNPDKFVYFITQSNLVDIYDEHPILKNEYDNWLFHIINNIKHVKYWIKKTLPLMSYNYVHRTNKEGNNIFLESVKYNHLKTALFLIKQGIDFNHINHNGHSFIHFIRQNFNNEKYKRGYFKILIFISKFISNDFEKSLSFNIAKEIQDFLKEAEYILKEQLKSSATAYFEYWNNIINFNEQLLISSRHLKEESFKKQLEQSLQLKPKSTILIKI